MKDPLSVLLLGPSSELDPFVEGDIRWLTGLLERAGYRVVGYRGHWNVFHYAVLVVPGQA